MEQKQLQFGSITRNHYTRPTGDEIMKVCEKYMLHDLVIEDMLESHTQDKIDVYDDHLFLVVHFPKYSISYNKYIVNEFNIVVKQNNIISFSTHSTSEISKIADMSKQIMKDSVGDDDEEYIISPYFIVYRLLDGMYNKWLLSVRKFTSDLMWLEEKIFDTAHLHKWMLEDLMIKRRNSIFLKHTFLPHEEIMQDLHKATMKLFEGELEVYFEDLQYKIDKINNQIQSLTDNITSLADTYNTLMNMRTNTVVGRLTVFTVIVWVMTLVTWLYGMNVTLPGAGNELSFPFIGGGLVLIAIVMYLLFKRQKRL